MAKKRSTAIIGACGEHYVAAMLSGMRCIVAMPRAGVPGCDLLVSFPDRGTPIRLQVKTGTQSFAEWKQPNGEKIPIYTWFTAESAATSAHERLWYAYVWLNGWPAAETFPEVFFVHSTLVAECVGECIKNKEMSFFWFPASESGEYGGQYGLGKNVGCS